MELLFFEEESHVDLTETSENVGGIILRISEEEIPLSPLTKVIPLDYTHKGSDLNVASVAGIV